MGRMNSITKIMVALLFLTAFLASGCAPLTAEESERERAYYEQRYANEPEPEGDIARLLDFLDSCVGAKYVFGGQGHQITHTFIDETSRLYAKYLTDGRVEYLRAIADKAKLSGHHFPEDYAFDCSGLWWYAVNELHLYEEYTDRTAHDTFRDDCTPIVKEDLRPGDIVFVMGDEGRIVHMGIVGRHGHIYEAVSGFVGVVYKRTVDRRVYNDIVRGGVIENKPWDTFGRPKIFE